MSDQKQPDQYKRITQAQFEIWLDNPVTIAYMQCLEWSAAQIEETMSKGGFIDSSNADLTMSQLHSAMGEARGLIDATFPEILFEKHEMLELREDKE